MARRLIGVDIDDNFVRTALVDDEKGVTTLLSVQRHPRTENGDLADILREAIGETGLGDRIAAALPATQAFIRLLRFPFAEDKKIAAALPMELSLQLPVNCETCTLASQKPVAGENGFRVAAAAIQTDAIESALGPFDSQEIPLNVLGLSPFSQASGLKAQIQNGLLVTVTAREITLALITEGEVVNYRLLQKAADINEKQLAEEILRAGNVLRRSAANNHYACYLIGSGATPGLLERLQDLGEQATIPRIELDGQPLAAEFLPAVALALRAGISDRERDFNLRSGPFALKSEWGRIKKRLIAMATLLVISLTILSTSAYLAYSQKSRAAAALQQEITRIFRDTFPGTQAIVDAPLQMRAQLAELQKISRMVGSGDAFSTLNILAEISRNTPGDLTIDIRDLSYTPEAVRLEGVTSSFDAINRLSKTLQQSPLFEAVRIDDAKMSLDGNQVDFRITLPLRKEL
ncbi:type II secretion system protein GspL [Trichloromonas sp.]|uniref:type II secretion system protein GspL n=1 Tax=Trichloromonas sp. TaxID=3069249 RepID=UPI003D81282C